MVRGVVQGSRGEVWAMRARVTWGSRADGDWAALRLMRVESACKPRDALWRTRVMAFCLRVESSSWRNSVYAEKSLFSELTLWYLIL